MIKPLKTKRRSARKYEAQTLLTSKKIKRKYTIMAIFQGFDISTCLWGLEMNPGFYKGGVRPNFTYNICRN